jgi:hypothetical protein
MVGMRMPFVWLHWGFTGRNIYRADDHITVVDWEDGSRGPGMFDLLFFVTNWYCAIERLRGKDLVEAVARLYLERRQRPKRTVRIARESILRYMQALRIDERFLAPMLSVMCIMRALGRLRLHPVNGNDGTTRRARNLYVEYISRLAVNVDELFSERWR